MTNNLRKVKQELCSFAKRYKDFKYTDSALFAFLLTGFISIKNDLFAETKNTAIEVQKNNISISMKDMKKKVSDTRTENNKLLKNTNLELIQLMEQGDHVIKSPWSSWQYGINSFYNSWNGSFKGSGDKQKKYMYEGIYQRGEWWEKNVSLYGNTYKRLIANSGLSSNPSSSLSNKRNELEYGLVGTIPVPDAGVPFIIEPVISINTPPLPNLNVNPTIVTPTVRFNIPVVITNTFNKIDVSTLKPNVFEPPALDDVSTGFAQGYQVGIDTHPNFMVSNGDVTVSGTGPLKIRVDDLDYYREGGYQFTGKNDSLQRTNQTFSATRTGNGTRGAAEGVQWAAANPNSMQTFLNVLTDSFSINGNIELKNNTINPGAGSSVGITSTNTLRVVSVNHAYGRVDKTIEFNMNGDVDIYGRDGYGDPIIDARGTKRYNNKPHMTIGIEHQAYGSIGARAINNGIMTLEKESAKDSAKLGTNLVGMTAMIEDYNDFRTITPSTVPNYNGTANSDSPAGWYYDGTNGDNVGVKDTNWAARRQTPWESTLENRGKIIVNAIDSIGIDFAQYAFRADLTGYKNGTAARPGEGTQPTGSAAYNNKGSLNIYVRVGDIELNSVDTDTLSGIQGSYGLRVPNIFKHYTNNHIYYDETVIDGTGGEIIVRGSHNVGTSISKLITGSERVLRYQSGNLTSKPVDGAKNYLTARPNTDPIGNIYNLNILVDGTENIGLLRKSDYMESNNLSADGKTRLREDFVITDSHVETIDFTSSAKGGVLFRTDKFGINLAKDNFMVTAMQNKNVDTSGNDVYNIVMLANGTTNAARINAPANLYLNLAADSLVKVKNTKPITIGATANTGYNMIGLMAYNGGVVENNADITVNTKNSIGVAIEGIAERKDGSGNVVESKGSSGSSNNSNIKMTGDNSIGVYNNGRQYTMNGGSIEISGNRATGVYASAAGTSMGTTILNGGTVTVSGDGSTALYATGGSDITLNGTTMNVNDKSLLFYGGDSSGTDYSQINLTGNATANIRTGGTAFYIKGVTVDPIGRILTSTSAANGTLTLNMDNASTLIVAEGNGGNSTVGGRVSSLSSLTGGTAPGIAVSGVSGTYTPFKATRLHLLIDSNSNLDNAADAYLNSEFSSSSVTVDSGITVSGSGAITSPSVLATKSRAAISQKNTTSGVGRNDVILTNNGTINLTGNEMAGIVGEFSEIYNNSILKTTGNDSAGIIVSNGGIATNSSTGVITVGTNGVGIAGINYLGVTDTPKGAAPSNGNRGMEIVNNGTIISSGTSDAIGILALDDESENISGAFGPHNITLGNGSKIDVSAGKTGIGVYSKIANRNTKTGNLTDNGADIKINSDGIGFYTDGTIITATGGTIESVNGSTGKGIYTNESVTTSKNIKLLGDKSIGIHTYGNSSVNVNNTGVITMGDSTDKNNPSIGIYAPTQGTVNHTGGQITVGNKSLGIYSINNSATVSAPITAGDEGMTVYKKGGNLTINGTLTSGNSSVAVYGDDNVSITNNSPNIKVGDNSFGFVILNNGTNNYTGSSSSVATIGSGSVYLYKAGEYGTAESSTTVNLSPGAGKSTGIYAKDKAVITNKGTLNFAGSVGNIGAYAENGGTVYNEGILNMTGSDITNDYYSIGMAARNAGKVVNKIGGTINVTGNYGIGMFAEGVGSRAENYGTINLVSSGELKGAYGMYLNNGAYGYIASGATIKSGAYSGSSDKESLIGVAVLNGSTLENHGTIDIDARNSNGVYVRNGIIKNYGTINISGANSYAVRSKNSTIDGTTPVSDSNIGGTVNVSNGASILKQDPDINNNVGVGVGGAQISPTGVVTVNGEVINIHDMTPGPDPLTGNFAFSNVGIYVDTLGRTKPINWVDGFNPGLENDLIIGAEAADITTSKAIKIGKNILSPYVQPYINLTGNTTQILNAISGSLTWVVKPIAGASGYPEEAIMAKIPYTDFVSKTENAWNFTDGLEQRYGIEGIGTREKQLFNRLNSIGKNEQALLTQAFDEMMGHQYGNLQQRINATGNLLDKEFKYLKNDWRNPSKQNNKIKVFGMRDEYRTDTAGIIDYTSNSYGVAYVHEDEKIKMGNSSGWYAGAVTNRFKFKDIGSSKENQTMLKAGVFKTMSPKKDHNGALQWTIGGDVFVGINDMKRRFLVVDEVFEAKSDYHSYGVALKTDLGYDIRMSERTHLRPYGALKLEYGKFNSIKEDRGEMRLEIEGNDYFSVKPEVGMEFKYVQPLAVRTNLSVGLTAAYENELGKVGDVNNRGRVRYTTADWFGIRGEKEDRRGNGKFDLNIGVDNTRFGVTVNAGYDTKGNNVRGGIGFRAIY